MGTISAKNDLPAEGEHSHKVDFRVKLFGNDPHTDPLLPGGTGAMSDEKITVGKDYSVEAQVKQNLHRDVHLQIDNVKVGDTVTINYTGDQYLLSKFGSA